MTKKIYPQQSANADSAETDGSHHYHYEKPMTVKEAARVLQMENNRRDRESLPRVGFDTDHWESFEKTRDRTLK